MELRPGYKQTEVGAIPIAWDVKPLSALPCKVIDCHHSTPVWTSSGVVVIRNQNIRAGKLDLTEPSYTDEKHYRERVRRALPAHPDLVITREAPMGQVCMISPELKCCLGQRMVLLRIRQEFANSLYVLYALQAEQVQRAIAIAGGTGSTVSNLRIPVLKSLPIPTPDRREQRAIAEALSDVDALLGVLDQFIAKKRDLKQAAMQQLLTGQTRLPGFAGEWVAKPLGRVADIKSGGTPSTSQPHFWNGDVPWCTPTDITALRGRKYLTNAARTISATGLQASSAEVIAPRSLIMTSRATIGECAINLVPMTTNQGFKNLVPFAEIDVEFLYYLMTTQKSGLIALCGGSTFLEIGKKQLIAYEVKLPQALPEQAAIATILSDMDTELTALEARRDKTRSLKQAMMQELLTGRTRLV